MRAGFIVAAALAALPLNSLAGSFAGHGLGMGGFHGHFGGHFDGHFGGHFHNHAHHGYAALWWPGGWGSSYYDEQPLEPAPAAEVPTPAVVAQPAAPVCPELIQWSPKLGRATHQKLCEE